VTLVTQWFGDAQDLDVGSTGPVVADVADEQVADAIGVGDRSDVLPVDHLDTGHLPGGSLLAVEGDLGQHGGMTGVLVDPHGVGRPGAQRGTGDLGQRAFGDDWLGFLGAEAVTEVLGVV
jgi:hypothetical protein